MPRAHAEQTDLRPDPVTFAHIERIAETGELLAVKAVEECGLSRVIGFLAGLLRAGAAAEGRVGWAIKPDAGAARRYTDPAYIYKMTDNWNPNK